MNRLNQRQLNLTQFAGTVCFWALLITTPCMSQVIVTTAGGSIPLFNGQDTSAWTQTGGANWYPIDNGVAVNQGSGMLVGKYYFTDYQIQFNYRIDGETQFSLFTHCLDVNNISPNSALEINLSNTPKKGYGPGSVMGMIKAPHIPVVNQWNTVFISSESNKLTVILNGVTVANKLDYQNFQTGPLAIQFGGGKLEITNLNAIIPTRW
ncbi:MAG: DUF1080 domain-containing protein [Polynucleobacter sp.]